MVQELMCGHRERLGDLEQAEATFGAAESLDSSWPLTLMSLARYASHRGDAERGLMLTNGTATTASRTARPSPPARARRGDRRYGSCAESARTQMIDNTPTPMSSSCSGSRLDSSSSSTNPSRFGPERRHRGSW
jgi:hypothetical protein